METFQLIIKGKVQGVFYRANAKKEAEKLGITGWIKNTDEGNVEAVISGQATPLQDFINWCRKGPDKARVDDVTVNKNPFTSFENFIIKK